MIDPRLYVLDKRLEGVKRVIAVTGWKGGIGKSSVAVLLALELAARGRKTGLLDLDFSGASDHIILGANDVFPEEIEGLEPPLVGGVRFMSAAYFAGERAIHLRGGETTDAIIELLAVTRWGELDFLIIDMPPGLGEASLDVARFIKRAELLPVYTNSLLSLETLRRSLQLSASLNMKVCGAVENMARGVPAAAAPGVNRLATIAFDPAFEDATGQPGKLLSTAFARDLRPVAEALC